MVRLSQRSKHAALDQTKNQKTLFWKKLKAQAWPFQHNPHSFVKMPEVQQHGFSWEKDLIRNVYGATEEQLREIQYTNKMDLPAALNALDHIDLSIKTTGSANTVCMADCLRVFDEVSSGSPLHMTVVHYKQDGEMKRLVSVVEVNLTDSKEVLFGLLTREDIQRLDTLVKSIPQQRSPTAEEHTALYALQKELQAKSGAIYLNIKCNSQQSRLQCSFNKFKKFLETNPDRIVAQSTTREFRGKPILQEVPSRRRQFRNNPQE